MRCRPLLLLMFLAGPCWADPCEQLAKPSVRVKLLDEPVSVDSQYGFKTLTIIGGKITRPGNTVLGLTRGTAIVKFETHFTTIVERSGQWECTSPQLTMSYGFSPMNVHVAREFTEGSCAYKEIYQHELRHVKTYQTHLAGIEKDLTDTLNARFATGGPWRGPVGQSRARIQQELTERWVPFIKREMNRVDAAQALVDSPEEYARVANSCNGDIRKLIR